jgi:DNA mismatch endonuclease, patch repair protein
MKRDKEIVSKTMRAIKSKWTKPEKDIHNYLKAKKIKHIMHPEMLGRPDILIKDKKIIIFYNGCFWHKCPKCWSDISKLNNYWKNKLINNRKRDLRNKRLLKKEGWKIIEIWGHDLMLNKLKNILKEIK